MHLCRVVCYTFLLNSVVYFGPSEIYRDVLRILYK